MLDLKYAIRQLLKNPGFTFVAMLTLGLCIGANLTIFAVLDTILVRPLPFPEPERLVVVENAYPAIGIKRGKATIADYFERRESIDAFESVSLYREQSYTIGESDSSQRVACGEVTPEFFGTLGVWVALGEHFSDAHLDYEGANLVAILTDRYWRNHYNADPDAVGQTIVINSQPAIIIGVLPPGFRYLSPHIEIFRPLAHHRWLREAQERHTELSRTYDSQMVARLAKNRSIAEAQLQIDAVNREWLAADPMGQSVKDTGYHSWVAPLHADHVSSVKPMLLLVQTAVLVLLLIGCINLASLQLVRASARSKEMAVRTALGASRWNTAASILWESVVLSLTGGLLGVWFAFLGVRLVRALGATLLPLGADIAVDSRIAIASIIVSVAVGVGIALPIIWINLRSAPHIDLQSETRGGTATRNIQQLRHAFVVAQTALAFSLLCGAGLLGTSLKRMLDESPGFSSQQVITGQISLPWMNYRGPPTKLTFVRSMLEKVRALPGVTHAAVSSGLPFTTEGSAARTILAEGMDASAGGTLRAHYFSYVSPDYWSTMRIPLLKGRFFEESDSNDDGARRVAIIDESVARQYWPNGDAIGRRFMTNQSEFNEAESLTVVGIVGRVKQTDLAETEMLGAVYEPYSFSTDFRLIVRTSVLPDTMVPAVERAVREVDPATPIDNFKTLQTFIDESLVTRRSPAIIAGTFAGVALLLAAVGCYGVLAYAVTQRRREIGVRIALGATRPQIAHQFLSLGSKLLMAGILLGCFGAWAAGRAMQSILFQVPSLHVPTLLGTVFVMSVVTLTACIFPAVRAANVDPMEAIRSE